RALGETLELVGRLVDRLQVALVLELAPGRRDVGVPALGHAPTSELYVALVERRLELQQEQVLVYIEDGRGHDPTTLATVARSYPGCRCPPNTSSRCTVCRSCTRPTRRCSTTSRSPSSPARRSACSATTAPASRRCCGSWRASIRSTAARRNWRRARPSGCSSRSRRSTSQRTSRPTSRTAPPRRRRCSTASTSSRRTTPTRSP